MDRTTRLGKPVSRHPNLRFIRGVDWNRFDDVTIQQLTNHEFSVSPDSDRMGVRLDGPELKRKDETDILFRKRSRPAQSRFHQAVNRFCFWEIAEPVGGLPKIAHVITVDLGVAAQLRAGDGVRFSEVSLQDAHRLLMERERDLERFRIGLSLQRL